MAAAYGLYTHIRSNKRRSIALLLGLFFLVYVMVYAGALLAEALSHDASLDWLLRAAFRDLISAAPWATLGTAVWIVIAYLFNQSLIDAVTGAREVTRKEQPRQGRRRRSHHHRHRAGCGRVAALDRDPLRAVAAARISRRRRLGGAHQESGCHDQRAAQDREPRRA